MAEVYLRRLSRWQAEQQRYAVADVHVGAYRSAAGAEQGDRQGFLDRLEQHVQRTGFDMVVADTAGTIGCAYGFRVPPTGGEWWPDVRDLRGALPADVEGLTASGRVFLLAELMVLPAHRRLGIATRLVEQLLIRSDADLVVAATERSGDDAAPTAAGEAFRAWGWSRSGVTIPGAGTAAGVGTGSSAGAGAGAGPEAVTREVWIRRPPR
ncbi:GNAT family N-acetyltransferase [Streptomyces sp. NPDC006285]|uniref:GNAT family N-acetyltransferase n=1 Tax=Streptomyces sp. NPDC006285 TaxID=3364742 RepID=UPI0036751A36